jgi:hypothetical protein
MTNVPQVFISHSSEDKPRVRKLANDLMREGISVWIDEAEIKIGDSILEKINQALLYSDVVLALLSKNSIKSSWVRKEIETAFSKNLEGASSLIIPVLLDSLESDEIPPAIRNVKWVDLSKDYDKGFNELTRVLLRTPKKDVPKPAISAVFDPRDLAKEVAKEVIQVLRSDPNGIRIPEWDPDPELVFVIISFSPDMDPIYEGIKAAGEGRNLRDDRVKDVPGDYKRYDKIVQMIQSARLVVADLTHERPNVYFELGFSRGLGKTVVTIAREATKVHFDVKDWTCFFYNDSRVVERYLNERFAYELGKSVGKE